MRPIRMPCDLSKKLFKQISLLLNSSNVSFAILTLSHYHGLFAKMEAAKPDKNALKGQFSRLVAMTLLGILALES